MPDSTHGDEPSALAGERLRRYLAEHDARCDGCGYNLRGVTTIQCPECGRVIGAPPPERPTNEMALKCYRCGCILHGLTSGPCPECGARDVKLADVEDRLLRRMRRPVPAVLGFCAASGLLLALWRLWMILFLKTLPSAVSANRMLLSLPVCLAPLGLAVLVYARPQLLRAESPGATMGRRTAISCAGVVLVTIALALT